MADSNLLRKICADYFIEAVMHFAAFCYVGESMTAPSKYYQNNVASTIDLLEVMVEKQISRFIFSSSCAIYGEPMDIPMTEAHPKKPMSPYGRTKLMAEQILEDFRRAYGLESVSLRYFNAAGADLDGELGEDHQPETHLIPLVLQTALGKRSHVDIFGGDYPTRDGTCIRDYVYIDDLVQAHLLALERLQRGEPGGQYNLGNGEGYSVKEVIEIAQNITGKQIPTRVAGRRAGDPAILVSSSEKAIRELCWRPQFPGPETIIETAWRWHKRYPNGFRG